MRIVPRTEIGLSEVVLNSSGRPRPLVIQPAKFVIDHFTGVNVYWGDVGDTANEIRGIERWASSVGKPNEYNYVVDQDPDDLVYEYAGHYRAAHSGGENAIAFGRLFLNGIHEPLTPRQVEKAQWLYQLFRFAGHIDVNTKHIGHKDAPGAATSCPGDLIYHRLAELSMPYNPQPPTPPPTKPDRPVIPVDPPDATDVGHYLVTDRTTLWTISAEVYGTGTRWEEIATYNLPDKTPNPGERWKVEGFTGEFEEVRIGDGPWSILDRVFGTDGWNKSTGIDQFWQWNGGDPNFGGRRFNGVLRALQPGELVWIRH